MVVQHNLTAMNSNRMLGLTTSQQAKNTEKLSSGYKINRAADDAAGLTISEKMRSQIRGLNQAVKNSQDGISVVQTAEGALGEVEDMLQRMNELAVKAANGTNTTADRVAIQKEVTALSTEIDRVKESSEFNTKKLLDGTFTGVGLQVGADNSTAQVIGLDISEIGMKGLFGSNKVSGGAAVLGRLFTQVKNVDSTAKASQALTIKVNTASAAKLAIDAINSAIDRVSAQRSDLGAIQNRLEHTIKNLDNIVENTTSAESTIRDTDMAEAMVEFTKNNILAQAGQSMLAQANQSTQGVLSLLG